MLILKKENIQIFFLHLATIIQNQISFNGQLFHLLFLNLQSILLLHLTAATTKNIISINLCFTFPSWLLSSIQPKHSNIFSSVHLFFLLYVDFMYFYNLFCIILLIYAKQKNWNKPLILGYSGQFLA